MTSKQASSVDLQKTLAFLGIVLISVAMIPTFSGCQGSYYLPSWLASGLAGWLGIALIFSLPAVSCKWLPRGAAHTAMAGVLGGLVVAPLLLGLGHPSGRDLGSTLIILGQAILLVFCLISLICCGLGRRLCANPAPTGDCYHQVPAVIEEAPPPEQSPVPCKVFWLLASVAVLGALVFVSVVTSPLVCTPCPSCESTGAAVSEQGYCSFNGTMASNNGPCYCYVACAIDGCHDGCVAQWAEQCFYYADSWSWLFYGAAAGVAGALLWVLQRKME